MTEEEFQTSFKTLLHEIKALPETRRFSRASDVHALLEKARAAGIAVPESAEQLDHELSDAAIEAQFDNLPV